MNISRTIPIFLISAVLVFGTTISMGIPASFAEPQYDSYGKDYDKKSSGLNKQNVNCNNIIINAGDSAGQGTTTGEDMLGAMAADDGEDGTGQWLENGDKKGSNSINENIVNFCKNKHNKIIVAAEPQTGSLTVKKEVFGCETSSSLSMDCQSLDNNDPLWLSCDNPTISITDFCMNLPRNFFDIEVLDDTDTQIQQFKGSEQGTTIPNLEPGMYSVNEIRETGSGILNPPSQSDLTNCNNGGFPEAGSTLVGRILYNNICIEYEDEQGNDCSTTTIAAGEDKTCIVKNYIRSAIFL
ncbi:MAG: hypothetical protein MRJ93_12040 [Nitrososphaeraceae archaeon]|nr:hypothetical protein [Nitrososphaeraceae archaeon]